MKSDSFVRRPRICSRFVSRGGGLMIPVLAWILACLGGGCASSNDALGSAEPNGTGAAAVQPETAPATLEEFVQVVSEEWCKFTPRCFGIHFFESNCEANYRRMISVLGFEVLRLRYDREQAEACLASMRSPDCEQSVNVEQQGPCVGVLVGAQLEGQDCASQLECDAGLYCDSGSQCPGVCRRSLELGASCKAFECGAELQCASGLCRAPANVGEACGEIACATGLDCVAGVCRSIKSYQNEVGEACLRSSECFGGNYCDPETSQCVAAGISGSDCTTLPCVVGYRCIGSVCQRRLEDGGACEIDNACLSASCISGVCTPRRATGEACENAYDCATANCANGACRPVGSCG